MTREERMVRDELVVLARDDRGRHLLQLALRGIRESGRGLTYGCWVKPDGGVAGCLFQHAYWQGVAEGVFQPAGSPKGEIKDYVGEEDFALVMGAIRAFDTLGRRRFTHWELGSHGIPHRGLDSERWHSAVERILIEALADSRPEGAGRPAEIRTPLA